MPLCTSHPPQEMRYVINDSKSDIVLASRRFEGTMKMAMEVGVERREEIREHVVERHIPQGKYERVELEGEMDSEKEAMIIYTSGTTSLPVRSIFCLLGVISALAHG